MRWWTCVWDCNGGANPSWTAYTDRTLRALAKCMETAGAGCRAKIQLSTCSGTAGQQWLSYNGGYRNPVSGRCLDDPGSTSNNGAKLGLWDCSGSTGQKCSQPGASAPARAQRRETQHAENTSLADDGTSDQRTRAAPLTFPYLSARRTTCGSATAHTLPNERPEK